MLTKRLHSVSLTSVAEQRSDGVAQQNNARYTNTNSLGDTLKENPALSPSNSLVRTPSQDRREDEKDKKEIFSKLEKPRVRYDVEVITKMIVYSGNHLRITSKFCTD
jgi:hypothetical protein